MKIFKLISFAATALIVSNSVLATNNTNSDTPPNADVIKQQMQSKHQERIKRVVEDQKQLKRKTTKETLEAKAKSRDK